MRGIERICNTMARKFRSSDEGMTVRTADGDKIGKIESVKGSKAHVKPASSLSDSIRQRLGWTKKNESVYELDSSKVDKFTDDAVMLKD